MNNLDFQYQELIRRILVTGTKKSDRTGTGTISVFISLCLGIGLVYVIDVFGFNIIHLFFP